MGTPFTVCLVLLAILLGAGFALDSDEPAEPAPKAAPATPITTLERRVEQIRRAALRDAAQAPGGEPRDREA